MFDFLKKKPEPREMRDLLFGDLPLAEWPSSDPPPVEEPWASFVRARTHLEAGRKREGIEQLYGVLGQPGIESRHYLQAWHFLREAGVQPPDNWAKYVFGVVVEVGFPQGADIVAAYTDGTARYLNHAGSAIVWEAPNDSLAGEIGRLLEAGNNVAQKIGPWLEPRPPAPGNDQVRLNMLTPSGLHFGQGGFQTLANDSMGGPIIAAALALMQRLIALSQSGQQG